jgi:methylase of polypeptide subunit release factors
MTGKMPLPDISGFARLSTSDWRALGLRLASIELTSQFLRPAVDAGPGLLPNLRLPIQRWHLARTPGPGAAAAALLMFEAAIPETAAREALGPALLDGLIEAGLIARAADELVTSPFRLSVADRLYLFSDDLAHGGDAVMGASEATMQLCRAAYPTHPVNQALEIGCGAGTIALVLSQRAARVVATDINPRALAMARVNAAINGIENVEFRAGEAYEPVAGESFDLVVSQPPFVGKPTGASDAAYLFGGVRGDELARHILEETSGHLTPHGRALVLSQSPDDWRATVPADARVLLLRYPAADVDVHCALYASAESDRDPGAYSERFAVWRDHLEKLGIRTLQTTLTVIQRDPDAPAWIATLDIAPDCVDALTSGCIDGLVAAHDLAAAPGADLLNAALRPPEGIVFAKEYSLAEPRSPRIVAHLPESSLGQAVDLNELTLLLISLVAEAESVRAAVDSFAARRGVAVENAVEEMIGAIRQALRLGLLMPAASHPPQPTCPPRFQT